MTATAALAL